MLRNGAAKAESSASRGARVRIMRAAAGAFNTFSAACGARGETLEQTRKGVNLEEFRRQFAGDSRVRRDIFDSYVLGAGLGAAYADATEKR